jgi:hypothetical protein
MSCNKCKTSSCCGSCNNNHCAEHSCVRPIRGKEIDTCFVPVYCDEGCEEMISSDCIIFPDGQTLTEIINTINLECCSNNNVGSVVICL